jgi:reactive intermediate/imine deaminase
MSKQAIKTSEAPQPIGIYSQAVRSGNAVYLSGQIGLEPRTMQLVGGIDAQIHQVFLNLRAVAQAAGASLDQAVKFVVFLTDMGHFGRVNEIMAGYVQQPYAARSAVAVAALPRGALVEIEAILVLDA